MWRLKEKVCELGLVCVATADTRGPAVLDVDGAEGLLPSNKIHDEAYVHSDVLQDSLTAPSLICCLAITFSSKDCGNLVSTLIKTIF